MNARRLSVLTQVLRFQQKQLSFFCTNIYCIFWGAIASDACHSISAKPTGIKKKRTSLECLKIRGNCIETLDYFISTNLLKLHSKTNAFKGSWYVSITYHSSINVHLTATYCIRSTLLYWSRLGRNRYGANTYLPNSHSRSE